MNAETALRAELAALDALPWPPEAVVRYIPGECTFRAPRGSAGADEHAVGWLAAVASVFVPFARSGEEQQSAADVLWAAMTWVRRDLRDTWLVFGPGEIAIVGAAQATIRGELMTAAEVLWRSGPGFVTRIRTRRWPLRDVLRLNFWDGSAARLPVRRGTARTLRTLIQRWPSHARS